MESMRRRVMVGPSRPHWDRSGGFGAFMVFAFAPSAVAMRRPQRTLDQVRQSGQVDARLPYRRGAVFLSGQREEGEPATPSLCQKIADEVKAQLGLTSLNVEWVPVTLATLQGSAAGKGRLLCGADSATLSRMKEVDFRSRFSPGALARWFVPDGDQQLRAILADAPALEHPVWRGAPARTFISKKTFSVVKGTTAESWLDRRLKEIEIEAEVVPVSSYEEGIQRVLNQSSDVLFRRPCGADGSRETQQFGSRRRSALHL